MSIDFRTYKNERRRAKSLRHKLVNLRPLSDIVLHWLDANRKSYSPETLKKFDIKQGTVEIYAINPSNGKLEYATSDPCIAIPVGPILRCYRFLRPKQERWIVVPAGYPAQWLGDLSWGDLILTEGEWDFLRLQDEGFQNAVTHTAGAGTWLPGWSLLFKGKRIWICYDRDRMGQLGAAKAAKALQAYAYEIRLVDLPLPGTPEANDVSDYFRLGGDTDGFKRILERARFYIPKTRVAVH